MNIMRLLKNHRCGLFVPRVREFVGDLDILTIVKCLYPISLTVPTYESPSYLSTELVRKNIIENIDRNYNHNCILTY